MFWKETFASLGLRVVQMSAEEHDREAAFTQGITHVIGRVLKDMDLQPSPIATVGYKKLLEIVDQTCNDPWQLFLDLQQYNPYTRQMRQKLQNSFQRILTKL
jgi:prephenate dehydrogenase